MLFSVHVTSLLRNTSYVVGLYLKLFTRLIPLLMDVDKDDSKDDSKAIVMADPIPRQDTRTKTMGAPRGKFKRNP